MYKFVLFSRASKLQEYSRIESIGEKSEKGNFSNPKTASVSQ